LSHITQIKQQISQKGDITWQHIAEVNVVLSNYNKLLR